VEGKEMQVLMHASTDFLEIRLTYVIFCGTDQALETAIVIEPLPSKAFLSDMDPFLSESGLGKNNI